MNPKNEDQMSVHNESLFYLASNWAEICKQCVCLLLIQQKIFT